MRLPKLKRRTWLLGTIALYLLMINGCVPVRVLTGIVVSLLEIPLPQNMPQTLSGQLQYTTLHGEFTAFQETGIIFSNTFKAVDNRFQDYKRCHPTSPDTVLYRTYSFKPYMFWEVGSYLTQPWWKLPYLPANEVKPRLKPRPVRPCPDEQEDLYWHNRNL